MRKVPGKGQNVLIDRVIKIREPAKKSAEGINKVPNEIDTEMVIQEGCQNDYKYNNSAP